MIKINYNEEFLDFIITNIKRSGFIYGNIKNQSCEIYIKKREDKIIALTTLYNKQFLSFLFSEDIKDQEVDTVLSFSSKLSHIGGTIIGDYKKYIEKYFYLPNNYQNEVATITNYKKQEDNNIDVVILDESYINKYVKAINKIEEFDNTTIDIMKKRFQDSCIVAVIKDDKIISSATLTSISDKTGVIISVFTDEDYKRQGFASACVQKLLDMYAKDRTLFIFFSNPHAKKLYLAQGFKVNDRLIMFK